MANYNIDIPHDTGIAAYILRDGKKQQASLEDILALFNDKDIQWLFCGANLARISGWKEIAIAPALAFADDAAKEKVYRNLSPRIAHQLKKDILANETYGSKNNYWHVSARSKVLWRIKYLMEKDWMYKGYKENIILEEAKHEKQEDQTPEVFVKEEPALTPVEKLVKEIEVACADGGLYIDADHSRPEDFREALARFEHRADELKKITCLIISPPMLDAAGPIFAAASLKQLTIDGNGLLAVFPECIRPLISLVNLSFNDSKITEIPRWLGELTSLVHLEISGNAELREIPDRLGELTSLVHLKISGNAELREIPDSIAELKSLKYLDLSSNAKLEKIPDRLGELTSLVRLKISGNAELREIPDSIAELKSLECLDLSSNAKLEKIPGWLGELTSLVWLKISGNAELREIPDSIAELKSLECLDLSSNAKLEKIPGAIGSLEKLTRLDLKNTAIESLPDTLANLHVLKRIDIRGTKIRAIPPAIASRVIDDTSYRLISSERPLSRRDFIRTFYKIVKTTALFKEKAEREGLLAIEEELEDINDDFFKQGLQLVIDGTDSEIIRKLLGIRIERERDYYLQKLMKVAMEGILAIQECLPNIRLYLLFASMVDIKDNLLEAACARYFSGDVDALDNVDFLTDEDVSGEAQEEREEVRFIRRVMFLYNLCRREGLLALEAHIDREGITAGDIFDYGLPLIIDGYDSAFIDTILTNMIERETDPVQKNLALAKKEAVLNIQAGNLRLLPKILCAYFDQSIAKIIEKDLE